MAKARNVVEYAGKQYVRRRINGYIYLYEIIDGKVGSHGIAEHRLVYELAYGVKLPHEVNVHHLNRDITDNRPENLIALSMSDHTKLHAFEDREYDMEQLQKCEVHARERKVEKSLLAVEKARAKLVAYDNKIYHKTYNNGYVMLYPVVDGVVDYGTRIPEHKLVYELTHGVELPSKAIIHHINGVIDDNRPENLELYDSKKRACVITKKEPLPKTRCVECGATITRGSIRCSACHQQFRREGMPSAHVTKEELGRLIQDHSNRQIAAMYGVSDRAVCKWRKKFGLPSANEQHGWNRGGKVNQELERE